MTTKNKIEEVNVDSPWYYFYSVGCAYCTKVELIVEELIEEGHEILKLDINEPNNKKLATELNKEYKKGCGTPWLINADTGNHICGFKHKDDIRRWRLNGADFPTPPPPNGPFPKMPYHNASDKEVSKWKKDYKKWVKDNEHLPNLQEADELLKRPRPKSDPPKFPDINSTEKQIDEFSKTYDKWAKENDHIPNLQSVDKVIERFKMQRNSAQGSQKTIDMRNIDMNTRISNLETKLDKLMLHLGVK